MNTKDSILKLRKSLDLSQVEFAEKLSVTRQAVSRWENGVTIPSTDMLKLIAQTFCVSVDHLLGHPIECQSCGMLLEQDINKGTEKDGSKCEEYCAFCYQQGKFTKNITMEEMVEENLRDLDTWNQAAGLQLTQDVAREQLRKYLPTLKRWK